MSIEKLSTPELLAEIERRKTGEVQSLRDELAELRKKAAAIEAEIAKRTGAAKVTGQRKPKAESVAAVAGVMSVTVAPISVSMVAEKAGLSSIQAKSALDDLLASGKVVKTGKARGTLYVGVG